jgi:hypothetical protein
MALLGVTPKSASLPAGAQANAMAVFANTLGTAITNANKQNTQGIFDLRNGVVNDMPLPPAVKFTSASNNAADAETVTQYIFNNNSFTALVTDNGSGASSITNAYSDGFSGKWNEQAMRSYAGGQGLRVYGFNVQYTIAGVANPSALVGANMAWTVYNGYNKSIPYDLDFSQALRNTQYNAGLLTFQWDAFLSSVGQFQIEVPANNTLTLSWFTAPLQG